MRRLIENGTFDEERALYLTQGADIRNCLFAGPNDGESALKESRDVSLEDCKFSLRYPLWHVRKFSMKNCSMDSLSRAAIWYSEDGDISGCALEGIKAVRECRGIRVSGSRISSPEFGWKCSEVSIEESEIESEYIFLDSRSVSLRNVRMSGKYSFQYVDGLEICGSILDTKDAFWHSRNVTVRDSVVRGEYLGWFSDGLTLVDCRISGTQPLCYCKNLRLVNCRMEGCDLSFEYSDVLAEIDGRVDSVKNPRSGRIVCDSAGEVILENSAMECSGEVVERSRLGQGHL